MNSYKQTDATSTSYAIIGKIWNNGLKEMPRGFILSNDRQFVAGSTVLLDKEAGLGFKTDRNMPTGTILEKGTPLAIFANENRRTEKDPNFSVSALLPAEKAEALIAGIKANKAVYDAAHPKKVL